SSVSILGPFAGKLQDSGERLRLERPGPPITATNGDAVVPFIVVDEVRYNDKPPWPLAADGEGPSLQRRVPTAYGNEPTNWFASGITAGADNVFNLAPTVTILSPTNGAGFNAPASFTVSALAIDSDGVLTKVEFYRDGLKVGEATNSPFDFNVANLGAGTYRFTVKARDNGLATASASVTVVVNPPPVGTGTGLFGEYYDDLGFAGTKLTRIDSTVNFHWGGAAPDPSMGPDQFSVRWTGQVQPRLTAPYTFYTVSDDGVRLWVNNLLLIDNWTDHGDTENSGSISLVAGARYDIRMEMYENGGGATATLAWSTPDLLKEIIPATQLYSMRRPTILAQPQSQFVRAGTNVTFRVTADGTPPLAWQWFFNGASIPGATATNLPLINVQTSNSGNYFVVITNSEGSITSVVAALVLIESPVFTQQPQSQTVLVGDTVTLNAAVSGTAPMGYRWRKNGQTYVPFGVATATLTMTNVQLTNAGTYTVVATNVTQIAVLSATAVLTVLVDTDGDRMSDVWEIANGFNTNSVADANIDTDGDGMTNLQEYIAGTNPRDPSSYLKVDRISMTGNATLFFAALSNRTYTVQLRDGAAAGVWMQLTNLLSAATNRMVMVIDPTGGTTPSRYYRLATPALP
ncbi:MAG TPA: PA14 domain-containing protein, partial [Verrucomicrobiae bacterium]